MGEKNIIIMIVTKNIFKWEANKGLYRIKSLFFGLWRNVVTIIIIMNIIVLLLLIRAAINSGITTLYLDLKHVRLLVK